MRLRYDKHAKETIARYPQWVKTYDRDESEDLTQYVQNASSLVVEIGSGKGKFLTTLASNQPECFHFGFEMFDSAIVKGLHKLIEKPLENLLWIRADAQTIASFFPPQSIETLYLNFSDPWPKARHEKRRLTHPRFLQQYATLLKPGGTLRFKTDNTALFDYSLDTLNQEGWTVLRLERDLHATSLDNIETEFEARFKVLGPIHFVEATRRS
jgi:tRNA (guanine-N7-)-methyltransferase